MRSLDHRHHTLAESDGALAGTTNATLDHEEILIDLAVVRETTDRGDALLSEISLGRAGHRIALLADAQHALVDLGTVVVTLLTSTSHVEFNAGRMPGTNTGDLAKTSVGLSRQAGDTPSTHDTGITVTAGSRAHVKDLTLAEHLGDINLLLEKSLGEIDLSGSIATVDLNLHEVGNLLSELQLADLGVGKHTDNLAILLDALDLGLDLLGFSAAFLAYLVNAFFLEEYQFL